MNEQMNNDEKEPEKASFISISEAEELTGIPNATLKRYMLNHEQFIYFKKEGREYRIKVTELDKLKYIRKLYTEGLKKEAVNERLERDGVPVTITFNPEESETGLVSVNAELAEMKNMMKAQMNFNHHLLQELEEMKEATKAKDIELAEERKKNQELLLKMQEGINDTNKALQEDQESNREMFSKMQEEISNANKILVEASAEKEEKAEQPEESKSWWKKLFT